MRKSWVEYLEERLYIGDLPIPESAECRHFLVVGRSGTGKTRLLYSFLQRLRKRKGVKVLVYDFKGDYVSGFFQEGDLLFNPLDVRTLHWCPLREIQMISDVDSLATSLIPPARGDDRFWVDGARDVFSAIAFILKVKYGNSNQELFNHVSMNEKEMLDFMRQALSEGFEAVKRAIGYLEQGQEKGAKVAGDILATMHQYTNCFFYTKHLEDEFSIQEWVESGEGFLFLVGFPKLRDTLRPLFSLFVDTTLKTILSLPENPERRIFLVLDEFATLQKLPTIIQGLEQGRSKGLGIIMAMQDVNQLERIYSRETMNSIVNNCSILVAFSVNDPATQEYISRAMGEFEKLETDESLSMGPEDWRDGLTLRRQRRVERVVLPSELGGLPDLTAYVKILDYPITKTKIPFVAVSQKTRALELDQRFMLDQRSNIYVEADQGEGVKDEVAGDHREDKLEP